MKVLHFKGFKCMGFYSLTSMKNKTFENAHVCSIANTNEHISAHKCIPKVSKTRPECEVTLCQHYCHSHFLIECVTIHDKMYYLQLSLGYKYSVNVCLPFHSLNRGVPVTNAQSTAALIPSHWAGGVNR